MTKQKSHEYLVDSIFPRREVHLIAGPSGAGKTTWLFQFLRRWWKGESIFGYASYPQPFRYISCDRSGPGIERTMRRCGTSPEEIPYWSAVDHGLPTSANVIIQAFRRENPGVRVLIIEGLAVLLPGGRTENYVQVAKFLTSLTQACQSYNLTIIGVVHSPKAKKDEQYLNPRERVLGSAAWAAYADGIILIEPTKPDQPDVKLRNLYLLPRNAPEAKFLYEFRDGLLVPAKANDANEHVKEALTDCLRQIKPGTEIDTDELISLGQSKTGVSRSTILRWVAQLEGSGRLRRTRRGVYELVSESQASPDLLDPLEALMSRPADA